jgi:hypothetical protein
MPTWLLASVIFFAYLSVVALAMPRLRARARLIVLAGSGVGLAICGLAYVTAVSPVLHAWVYPPALLLLGYWTSGVLFHAPMTHLERRLCAWDRAVNVDAAMRATPAWLRELLELAYAGVYLLVPAVLIVHLTTSQTPDADRFWGIVLATDFVCFGTLPWVQTRPPRSLAGIEPWRARFRPVNLHLLSKGSIQANTFPSGHAAEAAAAVLLAIGAPWPFVAAVAVAAVMVTAGAVLGRYHYAADAIAGWAVAVAVWALLA